MQGDSTADTATLRDGSLLRSQKVRTALWLMAIAFCLLRFVHLAADYPRNIRWDDGILTDEGWYASSAINQHLWGTWLLSGDMNISVLMPVWPLIVNAAFHVFGFHVEVIRGLTVVASLVCLFLLCQVLKRYGAKQWTSLFVFLAAVNPWAFALSRSAFLELPMMVAFFCALLLVAPEAETTTSTSPPLQVFRMVLAGLLIALAILTKTSALVLLPILLLAILQRNKFQVRSALRDSLLIFATVALPYALFLALYVRPHSIDALYYMSVIPSHVQFGFHALAAQVTRPFRYAPGSDHLLFLGGIFVVAASLLSKRLRRLWRDPLFCLAGIWTLSVLTVLILLNNVMVHYLALLIPGLIFLAIALLRNMEWVNPRWSTVLLALVLLDGFANVMQVSAFMLHPTYRFRDAAVAVRNIVVRDGTTNEVVLGTNMHEVAMQSGLKPVNLFAHSAYITRQVQRYQPAWWLQYSSEDDGSCYREVLAQKYIAQKQGEWPIAQDARSLTLYKLIPQSSGALPATLTERQKKACRSPWVASQREFPDVP